MEEFKGSSAADAVLVAGTRAMEHYQVARYGTEDLRWPARSDAAKLLDQTLEEEKELGDLLKESLKNLRVGP